MIAFDLWTESFIFALIYSVLVIVPCILVTLLGRKMIDELGRFPSKTPVIQVNVFYKLVVVESMTFIFLIGFYHILSG